MRRVGTVLAIVVALLVPSVGVAQSATSSTFYGVVKDSTGGALPGASVTVTSPALQVPAISVVTGADGSYRVPDLPPGTYTLTYKMAGFSTVVRAEVKLTTGFQAKLDITMSIGGLESTITVTGESPIVDVSSTSTGATLTRDLVESIPRAAEFGALLSMTPGTVQGGTPDVGGSNLTQRTAAQAFGVAQQPNLRVEGISISTGAGTNSGVVFSSYNFDEIKVSTSGADAETSTPGVSVQAVLKSGSNKMSGSFETTVQRPELQSSNLTAKLTAQGITAGNALQQFYGVSGDFGGRIVRDKVWFYAGWNKQTRVEEQLGFVEGPGADGRYLTGDEPASLVHTTLDGQTAKLSYQVSRKIKLIGVYQRGAKVVPEFNAGRFTPRESLDNYLNPTYVYKGELQSALNDRVLVNANVGLGGYVADHSCTRGAQAFFGRTTDLVSRNFIETGLNTGPCTNNNDYRVRRRYQLDSSISYFPERSFAGRHEFKVGESIYWENIYTLDRHFPWGTVRQNYDLVDGRSNAPYSITAFSNPHDTSSKPNNRLNVYSFYAKDTWRITNEFTANLGVRFERQEAFAPAQTYPGTPEWPSLFPAKSFDRVDALTWNKVMPRVGLAYQLFAKSVLKGTWGIYADTAGDDFAGAHNGNASQTASFRWRDLNGNDRYDAGESNLVLNGPDFLTISSAANNILNLDLKQPTTREMSVAWEQELSRTMSVRFQAVSKEVRDSYQSVNVLRPYDAYTNQITRTDPGPDGVTGNGDDGGSVTLFDYRSEFRGAAFVGNKRINSTTPDNYFSIETGVSKRMSQRWQASVSYFATKRDTNLTSVISNPNQERFNKDETWSWGTNVNAVLQLPKSFQLSTFVQARSGNRGARTVQFRNIPNSSNITVRMEEVGSLNNPSFATANMKVQRKFRLAHGSVDLTFDVFNIFNTAAATGITTASGPTFGFVTSIMAPRVAQVGARFSF